MRNLLRTMFRRTRYAYQWVRGYLVRPFFGFTTNIANRYGLGLTRDKLDGRPARDLAQQDVDLRDGHVVFTPMPDGVRPLHRSEPIPITGKRTISVQAFVKRWRENKKGENS